MMCKYCTLEGDENPPHQVAEEGVKDKEEEREEAEDKDKHRVREEELTQEGPS